MCSCGDLPVYLARVVFVGVGLNGSCALPQVGTARGALRWSERSACPVPWHPTYEAKLPHQYSSHARQSPGAQHSLDEYVRLVCSSLITPFLTAGPKKSYASSVALLDHMVEYCLEEDKCLHNVLLHYFSDR